MVYLCFPLVPLGLSLFLHLENTPLVSSLFLILSFTSVYWVDELHCSASEKGPRVDVPWSSATRCPLLTSWCSRAVLHVVTAVLVLQWGRSCGGSGGRGCPGLVGCQFAGDRSQVLVQAAVSPGDLESVLTHRWTGEPLMLIAWRTECKVMLICTRVLTGERTSRNGYHQCLCLQGKPQLLPASLGVSPRWVSRSDPRFFQSTVCYARTWSVWDFVCALQVWRLCVFQLFWPSKPDVLGVSQNWTPRLGSLRWGLDRLLPGENLCHCDHPLICGWPPQGCRTWLDWTPPISFGSFFIYLILEKVFCWFSDSSHW